MKEGKFWMKSRQVVARINEDCEERKCREENEVWRKKTTKFPEIASCRGQVKIGKFTWPLYKKNEDIASEDIVEIKNQAFEELRKKKSIYSRQVRVCAKF